MSMGSARGLRLIKDFTPAGLRRKSQLEHERNAESELAKHRKRGGGSGTVPAPRFTLGLGSRLGKGR